MKRYPAGAGCDDDPRRRWDRRRGDMAGRPVVVLTFCRRLNSLYGSLRRSDSPRRTVESVVSGGCRCKDVSSLYVLNLCRSACDRVNLRRSVQLGAKAAETLRSARSGVPGPSGEAAATEGPEGPRRQAVRSRGGRGARLTGGIGG